MSYIDRLYALYKNPKHYGRLKDSAKGRYFSPSCGDDITVYLSLDKGKVKASFEGKGCVVCISSASIFMEHINGKPLKEVENMSEEKFFSLLNVDLTPVRKKCALTSFIAFKTALSSLRSSSNYDVENPK